MKIVILGNIASGKTTFSNFIKEKYLQSELISIDSIRKQYGDGTMEKEHECKNRFIELAANGEKMQIIELTGVGELGERLFHLLGKSESCILVVYLLVNVDEINKRIIGRTWDTPIPFDKDNIPVAIKYTKEQYENGLLQKLLAKCPKAVTIALSNNDLQLMNRNLQIVEKNIELLMQNIK